MALVVVIGLVCSVLYMFRGSHEVYDGEKDYPQVMGEHGKYKHNYFVENDIFPENIPKSAKYITFVYKEKTLIDTSYLGYLVYECDKDEFNNEYKRLREIKSSENYLIYGAEKFPYRLCAVYADKYYGYIYALADQKNLRFIYVDLEFCNYYSDIDYNKIVDKEHLPYGFDATKTNKVRELYEKTKLLKEEAI